ncbi:MAG: heme transporter [Alcanivorax borkumensis]|mgnify:FL=1|jgi:heme exporter protein B|uniref:Heme exporter protein B n=1 Tax=Alcanivorax borkumensis (strain ATCC 700651 / DSM 11573 / NCIMB 13689 / SK2) TaxID=393595 RepID=Q0VR79_ALCBS|nr:MULTISPECIES: heme exporter protein CcmB [Alcanivorax]OJH06750.1 MAG: heme transporter [Alcanivorax borkumensis]EUC71671.1 Heme exporter protein B [Alcanivorax sp. 97CO-5]PKG03090.1 heme exporter protein CcmB [Alcanivorax sp. 97CO-6]CAL16319.1 Heme exporter protein B [Alcanivorax borkumensis SK2]BAP13772.1 heme exporter protein B [Alcanivorax sp. NBRC 101098]
MSVFRAALSRELLVLWRSPAEIINPLFFFVMVISLFPLAISPKPELLALVAPGVLWVAALLAVMLSLDGLFRRDQESGVLELLLTAPVMAVVPVSAKLLAHWLLTGLPLVLISPVLAHMLQLPNGVLATVVLSLLLGTPALTIIGAIGAALTVGLNRGGILLAVLVLPLYIPVLIFGAGAVSAAVDGGAVNGILAILGALLALTISLGPLAVAAGLKISSGN